MVVRIISETTRRTKNTIKGKFRLSDKTTTQFEISRGEGWNQWGNSTDNLCLSVLRVEQLEQELLDI